MTVALVTGADGFAGSHLVEVLLENGYNVIGLVRSTPLNNLNDIHDKRFKIMQGDIMDAGSLSKAFWGCDAVYHLAAISGVEESREMVAQTWKTNTEGTLNVLQAAMENRVKRVMYCSTCHVFGRQEAMPIVETMTPAPIDIYSSSKLGAEILCRGLMNQYPDLDIVFSRAFNHFGERQRGAWLIPKVIRQALRSKVINLGAGTPTRDFTYVKDTMRGYVAIAEKGKRGEVYNLCSGVERSVKSIVDDIVEMTHFDGPVNWGTPRPADMNRNVGTYEKAKRELGWTPQVSWEEGLEQTVRWYAETLE